MGQLEGPEGLVRHKKRNAGEEGFELMKKRKKWKLTKMEHGRGAFW
jgi:hypothetical protein